MRQLAKLRARLPQRDPAYDFFGKNETKSNLVRYQVDLYKIRKMIKVYVGRCMP